MADELAILKQLQAGLNASFDAIYAAQDGKSLAAAKEGLIGLGYAVAGAAMGPAFTIMSLTSTPIQYMAIRIAIDLNVFELVAEKPRTLVELAEETKGNAKLLKRILRLVTAVGYLKQFELDKWEASPLTGLLAVPALRNWMIVHYDRRMNIYAKFPEWLKEHSYELSWGEKDDNIVMDVYGMDIWTHYEQNPDVARKFESAMSIQESFPPEMTPAYPFVDGYKGIKTDPEAVTLVDVGGGRGQAVKGLKKTYPTVPGRFIVQDLAMTAEKVDKAESQEAGFEVMTHNFFKAQPIKGAKYYHLRRVLHDWNDEQCLKILAALRPALDPEYSRLLICDFILPDISPGALETSVDLMMMTTCDGAERSELEWQDLLGRAGFKIEHIWRANVGTTGVIEASVA